MIPEMTADKLAERTAYRERMIAENTRKLERAYNDAEDVIKAYDVLITALDKVADTRDLLYLVASMRRARARAEHLLFTGYAPEPDSMSWGFSK